MLKRLTRLRMRRRDGSVNAVPGGIVYSSLSSLIQTFGALALLRRRARSVTRRVCEHTSRHTLGALCALSGACRLNSF